MKTDNTMKMFSLLLIVLAVFAIDTNGKTAVNGIAKAPDVNVSGKVPVIEIECKIKNFDVNGKTTGVGVNGEAPDFDVNDEAPDVDVNANTPDVSFNSNKEKQPKEEKNQAATDNVLQCYDCNGQCDKLPLKPCNNKVCVSIDFPIKETAFGKGKFCKTEDQAKKFCNYAKSRLEKAKDAGGVCYYCKTSECNKEKQPPKGAIVIVNKKAVLRCYNCNGQCDNPELKPCDQEVCVSIDFPKEKTGFGNGKYCKSEKNAKDLCNYAKSTLKKAKDAHGVCYYCDKSGCNKEKFAPNGSTTIVNE